MPKGMYSMEWYRWLAEENVNKFENWLIQWTRECGQKAVMLFDQRSLRVGTVFKIESGDSFYLVKLPRISMEYICISGNMCILRRVILVDKHHEEILYQLPDSWDGTTPWYAD